MGSLLGGDMTVENKLMQTPMGGVMRPSYSPMSPGQIFMQDLQNDPGQLWRNILAYFRSNPRAFSQTAQMPINPLLDPSRRVAQIDEAMR